MVMHASPSDTLAKFSPLRQTVEGFVVDLVRDVSVLQERVHAEHGVVPAFFTDAALSMRRPLLRRTIDAPRP